MSFYGLEITSGDSLLARSHVLNISGRSDRLREIEQAAQKPP